MNMRNILDCALVPLGARLALGLAFAGASPLTADEASRMWSPRGFAAVADGATLDTGAFQKAIDAAHAAGGGTVHVEPGIYCIGTLELRSGVTLHLDAGAVLKGSPRLAHYRRGNWPALILAKGQERVAITGEGTIDGQGKLVAADSLRIYESGDHVAFFPGLQPGQKVFTGIGTDKDPWIDPYAMQREGTLAHRVAPRDREDVATWRVDEFVRPQLLEFWQCRDVRVSGVTLKNAANWVQTYRECDDVVVRGVRVESTSYWNNDGLDIVNCRRVRIEDCDIDAADDGICLKSDPSPDGRVCEDISITRCRIRSSASALKLGTASHTGFRRIVATDLEIHDTYRSAVALESVDGGVLEDVRIARVRARNTGNALFIRIGQRNTDKPPGVVRDIELADMEVDVPVGRPDAGYEHAGPPLKVVTNLIPSSIVGLPDRPVERVLLRNITITFGGGGTRDRAEVPLTGLAQVPERRGNYPEFSMFGELPAWGLFLRHAEGVRLENVTLRLASPDYRAAIVADRVKGLALDDVALESSGTQPGLVLAGVEGEELHAVRWPPHANEPILRMPAPEPRADAGRP